MLGNSRRPMQGDKVKKGKRLPQVLLLPCLLTLGVLLPVYLVSGLFPFGGNTLAWGDFHSQVLPFLLQFKHMLRGDDGLWLSMANAGGMNFVGIFFYFLASPFTFLGLFVPDGGFDWFANILVLLKLLAAACTATGFFASPLAPFRIDRGSAGALGSMYALGGFSLLFYQNNVWLDALALFPLVALALLYMYKQGRSLPFVLAMAAITVCQFQLSFAVWVAVLLGGGILVCFFAPRHEGALFALRLGAASILSLLLSAVAWLPSLLALLQSARAGGWLDSFAGAEWKTHYYTTLPILLCTAAVFAALPLLLFSRAWHDRRVRFSMILFVLLSLPLVVEPINLMWHGGSYQSFPARYGFITLFQGLVLVSAAVERVVQIPEPARDSPKGLLLFVFPMAGYCITLLLILMLRRQEADGYVRSLWGDAGTLRWAIVSCCAGALALLAVFYARRRLWISRGLLPVALCAAVLLGGVYNGMLYIGSAARPVSRNMQQLAGYTLPGEGRVKTSRMYAEAGAVGAMGYASIAHYSSFTRQDYLSAYKKLGYSGYWMELSGFGGTALSDYFLNISGLITRQDGVDPAYREEAVLASAGGFALQSQPAGGYATVVYADPVDLAAIPEGDRFAAQNWIYDNVYKMEGDLFRPYEASEIQGVNYRSYEGQLDAYGVWLQDGGVPGALLYTIEVTEPETLYFDCFRYISNSLEEIVNYGLGVSVNGEFLERSYPNTGANGILCLGTFENETVEVRIDVWRSELVRSFGVWGMRTADMEALVAGREAAQVAINGSRVDVEAQAGQNALLLLPLAYDEGYRATVNGRRAEVHRVLDAFMAVELEEGKNQIQLRFVSRGLPAGLALLALGVALTIAVAGYERKKASGTWSDREIRVAGAARLALIIMAALTALALYLLPLALWAERGQLGWG